MWILLWVILSVVLLGSALWSLQILMRQKKAWEAYAKKKGLVFNKGTFMGAAEINGVIGNYKIAFFTAERQEADVRRRRYVTSVEITLSEGLVNGGVAGTQNVLTFMQSLGKLHPYPIDGWQPTQYMFVLHDDVIKAYLTPDRLETFDNILKTRNSDTVIVFSDQEMAIRLETSDPMQDADKMDKVITRILGLADKLRITPEQRAQYMALAPKTDA